MYKLLKNINNNLPLIFLKMLVPSDKIWAVSYLINQ